MTSHPSPRPVSALRGRMIEHMTVRGFTEETRHDYVRRVRAFAAFIRRPPDYEGITFKKNSARERAGSPRHRPPPDPVEGASGPT